MDEGRGFGGIHPVHDSQQHSICAIGIAVGPGEGASKDRKRTHRRVGLAPRRLYAQRHSFLSHALALRNSLLIWWQSQDTEELLDL